VRVTNKSCIQDNIFKITGEINTCLGVRMTHENVQTLGYHEQWWIHSIIVCLRLIISFVTYSSYSISQNFLLCILSWSRVDLQVLCSCLLWESVLIFDWNLDNQFSKLSTSPMTEASKIGIGPIRIINVHPGWPVQISSGDYNSVKKS
jgi:hypothetical protein